MGDGMSITTDTPGYKIYRDKNGKLFGLRDYWYLHVDTRDYLTITVKNDARDGWVYFSILDNGGYGPKHMHRIAEQKAAELNARDGCVIPCYAGGGRR